MTKSIILIAIIGLSLVTASAQVNSAVPHVPDKDLFVTKEVPAGSPARILGSNEQAADQNKAQSAVSSTNTQLSAAQKSAIAVFNHVLSDGSNSWIDTITTAATDALVITSVRVPSVSMSQEYRVGVGDVLDVQLSDMPTKRSTLFTVRQGGTLDYPLAGEPIIVTGLTADEVAVRLRARIKVLENPKVVVKVRDYFSHNVTITGLVADPGAKFLRREAIPLYIVLVEAQPRPEAIRATITRAGQPAISVDLRDDKATSTLVMPGDVVRVVGLPTESAGFFYAGGSLSLPGQKAFYAGLTLTQAVLACGGVTRDAGGMARVSRQGADGRLISTEYNLRQIEDGATADPVLQRGDRITVPESR